LTGGEYYDFNPAWFINIGNILIGTMMFNSWYPILEVILYWGLRVFFRLLDKGCNCFSCNKYNTRATSPIQYVNTYAAAAYLMHYKYSTLLNVVFVTFMFGFGMPILFPIAFLSICVLYFQEKILLYYGYRVPPMYDERLSQKVLRIMKLAPIFFLCFGYWMASNQ